MFKNINDELEALKEGMYRHNKSSSTIHNLTQLLIQQEDKLNSLKAILDKETLDFEKISKMSITGIFYTILGSRDEHIEKERQEALAAKLKYDSAKEQVEYTKNEIQRLTKEVDSTKHCETRYNLLIKEKRKILTQSNGDRADEILKLEGKVLHCTNMVREVDEAISAGNAVENELIKTRNSLGSAEGWGKWDMWGGGGLLTNAIKHSHIDDARSSIGNIQSLLSRFKTELADIKIESNINIDISHFDTFADFFFDGLIVDWMIQKKINDSQESVEHVKNQVSKALRHLDSMKAHLNKEKQQLENQLLAIIEAAQ